MNTEWSEDKARRRRLFLFATIGCAVLGAGVLVVLAVLGVFSGDEGSFPSSAGDWLILIALGTVGGALTPALVWLKSLELG